MCCAAADDESAEHPEYPRERDIGATAGEPDQRDGNGDVSYPDKTVGNVMEPN